MNQDFETIVMGNYAELCIMWRIAHVTNPEQAKSYDEKLKSLESVIKAFDLAMPDLADGDGELNFPSGSDGEEEIEKSAHPRSSEPASPSSSPPSGPPTGIPTGDGLIP